MKKINVLSTLFTLTPACSLFWYLIYLLIATVLGLEVVNGLLVILMLSISAIFGVLLLIKYVDGGEKENI